VAKRLLEIHIGGDKWRGHGGELDRVFAQAWQLVRL
jgi:hypothetical protein